MPRGKFAGVMGAALAGLLLVALSINSPRAQNQDAGSQAGKLYGQAMAMLKDSLDNKTITQALALLEKAAELDPDSEETWTQIAWRHWMLGDDMPKSSGDEKQARLKLFEKGMAAAEKAMALNPRSVGGLYWYTVNMAAAGEMRGILSSLSMAGTLFGNMSRVDRRDPYYLYGATRRFGSEVFVRVPAFLTAQFGFKPEYIEEDLQMNIEKWPNYFDNYVFLARVYLWEKNGQTALEPLDYVLSHDPASMPEERAENLRQQGTARLLWKEITGKEYPAR
ncbi:MAG TPA: hypothetical protein VM658_22735 [bacterium]|nr:hypothetical protein [bacterium]